MEAVCTPRDEPQAIVRHPASLGIFVEKIFDSGGISGMLLSIPDKQLGHRKKNLDLSGSF